MVWVREELESLELMMSSEAAQSNGKREERVKRQNGYLRNINIYAKDNKKRSQ